MVPWIIEKVNCGGSVTVMSVVCFLYNIQESEKFCSKDIVFTNVFNKFILIQEKSFNDSLKKVYI